MADRDRDDPRSVAARVARERLTRRLVGLAVLTVVVTAASALLPPRGSAERAAPVPGEDAAGVEVQAVPLGGLAASGRPTAAPVPTPATTPSPPAPSVASSRAAAEFAVDAPAPAREVATLKDHAAEEFDERHLIPPPPLGPAPRSVGVPVVRSASVAPTAASAAAAAPRPAPAAKVAAGGRESWVVQVGVFSSRVKADSVAGQMRSAGLPVPRIESVQLASGATRYRVRIPTGGDAATARTVRDRVNALPGAFGAAVKSVPAEG